MNKIRFEIGDKNITRETPAEWNELTLDQLLFVVPRIMTGDKESYELKRDIIVFLLDMKAKFFEGMNRSQMEGLFPAVDWMFEEIKLTKNPFPELILEGKKLTGLRDEMRDIINSQFAFADSYMNLFLKKGEEESLDLLLGCLYTEKGTKFNLEKVEENSELLKHIPLDQKMVILAFFQGCRNFSSGEYPDIFKKGEAQSQKSKTGWLGFFYSLAGPKTGTYTDVAGKNYYETLGIMRKINEEIEEMERLKNKK